MCAPELALARMCRAIAAAERAAPAMAAMGSWQRREVLEHCVREFQARFEELALSLCIEAGKPIKVRSSLHTFPDPLRQCACCLQLRPHEGLAMLLDMHIRKPIEVHLPHDL